MSHSLLTQVALLLNQSPQHVLYKVIDRIMSQSDHKVSVIDVGSGSASMWNQPPLNQLDTKRLELTLFEAKPVSKELDFVTNQVPGVAPKDLRKIPSESFDVCICFEVIEHMSKDSAYLAMYEMERISKSYVGVSTPNGFLWQPPSKESLYDAHVSSWKPSELRAYGFNRLVSHTGLRFMFGPYGLPKLSLGGSRVLKTLYYGVASVGLISPALGARFSAWLHISSKPRKTNQP